ncbi:MAG: GntR family transcriptional regulator, partial [Pseudomonadota bacterium]
FDPGERLKPADLQGEYGCSANTVRDVLLRLSKVGLVDFEMQRGFRARDRSPELRSDVTRFRILLEQEGAILSMRYGGLEWEAQLSAAHHKLSHIESQVNKANSIDAFLPIWSDAEIEFHSTLISSCQSPLLIETYANVYAQFRQQVVTSEYGRKRSFSTSVIFEHKAILDAALARDETACRAAIHDHLKRHL